MITPEARDARYPDHDEEGDDSEVHIRSDQASVAGGPFATSAHLVLTVSSRVFTAGGQARYRRMVMRSGGISQYMGRPAQASQSCSAALCVLSIPRSSSGSSRVAW